MQLDEATIEISLNLWSEVQKAHNVEATSH